MKKKLLLVLLSTLFIFGFSAVGVFAADISETELQTQITNATENTVTITDSVKISNNSAIDLQGKTVTFSNKIQISNGEVVFKNGIITSDAVDLFDVSGGKLILIGTNDQPLTITTKDSILYAHETGAIELDGASLTSENSPNVTAFADGGNASICVKSGELVHKGTNHVTLSAANGATVTIDGGAVKSDSSTTIQARNEGTVITINDGEVSTTGGYVAGYAKGAGKIVVKGGIVSTNAWCALSAIKWNMSPGGTIEVNGGTIKGAVGAYEDAGSSVKVTGGTIIPTDSWGVYVANGASAEISGGNIGGTVAVGSGTTGTLTVTGGTFSKNTTLPEGYVLVGSEGGPYTVKKQVTVTADAQTITYGGQIDSTKATAVGLLQGDSLDTVQLTTDNTTVTTEGVITPSKATFKNSENEDVTSQYYVEYKTGTLTITKADINPTVTIADWTVGGTASTPSVTGNIGEGTVTYTYKIKGAEDSTYSTTVPTAVGSYTIKASIAATDNTNAGEATADFNIKAASTGGGGAVTPTGDVKDIKATDKATAASDGTTTSLVQGTHYNLKDGAVEFTDAYLSAFSGEREVTLTINGKQYKVKATGTKPTAADEAAAADVAKLINALPDPVTEADADKVKAARDAYDKLTAIQQSAIPAATLTKLTTAESAIATINAGKEAQAKYEADVTAAKALTVKITKAKNAKGKKVKVTFKPSAAAKAGATGYQVKYGLNKKVTKKAKTKTLKKASAKSATVKKLKKGKTYYVKVRAYTEVTNPAGEVEKVYGKWSKVKKVKVKK